MVTLKQIIRTLVLVVFCQLLLLGSSFQVPRCCSLASRLPTTTGGQHNNNYGQLQQQQQQQQQSKTAFLLWPRLLMQSSSSLSDHDSSSGGVDTIDTDKVGAKKTLVLFISLSPWVYGTVPWNPATSLIHLSFCSFPFSVRRLCVYHRTLPMWMELYVFIIKQNVLPTELAPLMNSFFFFCSRLLFCCESWITSTNCWKNIFWMEPPLR